MNKTKDIIKLLRPVHWVKNLALFAAITFTGQLTDPILFAKIVWAFFAFNFASSATYIFNDIFDEKRDKLHPIKKDRPIASGLVDKKVAFFLSSTLAFTSLLIANNLSPLFFIAIVSYLILQVLYSSILKNIAIIDILVIATGFIIRVYSGAFVIDAHLSVWFLLCVISVALFLASGKRRSELNLIPQGEVKTRVSLGKYKRELLDAYVTMFGNAAWMSWALFTFFESPTASTNIWLLLAEISKTTTISKLLMATIPVVIFIIMRYESLIFEDRSETPEKVLLTDTSLVVGVVVYGVMVLGILYGGFANLT